MTGAPRNTAAAQGETLWTLEAWRGIAAWMVVYAHLHPLGGLDLPLLRFAFTGVDLFFVLSGFVFAPYLNARPLEVRAFAIRRFFRIYPAYILALGIYAGMQWRSGEPVKHLGDHLLFLHLHSREVAFHFNPAFWSLPAEVEYYLALPFLALLTRSRTLGLGGLVAIALLIRLGLGRASDPVGWNGAFLLLVHLPGMAVEFLLGACAWRFAPKLQRPCSRIAVFCCGLAGWVGLAALFAAWGDAGLDASLLRGQASWLAAACFAAMVSASALPPRVSHGRLVWLSHWAGKLSYGTYLLHIAAMRVVEPHAARLGPAGSILAAILITLVAAWLVYRFWEDPCRRVGRWWSGRIERTGS